MILAIAGIGAFLALLITGGAIMVIRRRNQHLRSDNNGRSGSSGLNHTTSVISILTDPTSKKAHSRNWDQKKLASVAIAPMSGAGLNAPSSKEDLGFSSISDDIPPVSGYNSWEHRGWITSHIGDDVETTTTMTNPMMGVIQTTIVTTPKNSKLSKGASTLPSIKTVYSSSRRRQSEQDLDGMTRSMTSYTRTDNPDSQLQESWVEGHPFHQPKNLEQKFEEKRQGAYYPISVEREYH